MHVRSGACPALLRRVSTERTCGRDRLWGRSREWSRSDRQGTARMDETWEGRRRDGEMWRTCNEPFQALDPHVYVHTHEGVRMCAVKCACNRWVYVQAKNKVLLAATPPTEALRMLFSATATGNKPKVLKSNDTSRAYMHARTASDRNVELCEKDKTEPVGEHRCGKLVQSVYKTTATAHNKQSKVTKQWKTPYARQSISVRVLESEHGH